MVVGVSRSTGVVLPGWRAVLLVIEGKWAWYRRNWRATAVSSVLQPLLFLLAFGVGFGNLIEEGGRQAEATGGVDYLVWLAPALLAAAAVQNAAMEASYPILSAFKWQRTYWAVTSTPVTSEQLAVGQLVWIACRLGLSGAVYLLVVLCFGAIDSAWMLAALPCAVLCGMALGAPLAAFAATVENEGHAFAAVFRFVVVPMTLFSGTFYPIDQLPAGVRPLAWISPLWHGTELCRGFALEDLSGWAALGHTAYLGALLTIGVVLVRRGFRVRLGR